jgi:hypothetical protein
MGYKKVSTRKNRSKQSAKKHRKTNKKSRKTNKKSRSRKTFKRSSYKLRGGNYPTGAYGPLMPGNGINQLGAAYDATVKGFPTGNHLPYNMNVLRVPEQSNPQIGGKNRKHKKQRGGGVLSNFMSTMIPLEPLNVLRSGPAALGHTWDKFNGTISSQSTMVHPTEQNLVEPVNKLSISTPVNINSIYDAANASVLKL